MKIKKSVKNTTKKIYRGGEITYPNGDVYDGVLVDGKKEGQGKMTYANGDVYDGPWVNDKKEGPTNGSMDYADGSHYYGRWLNDLRSGQGEMMTPTSEYDGEWLNGLKHGDGNMFYADDGYVYYGNWVNDHRQGAGTFYPADDPNYERQQFGYWQEDRYLGPVRPRGLVLTDHDTDADYEIRNLLPPDDDDDDDNREANQIHRASEKINLDKYLQIINVNTDSDYGDITDYVTSKFTPLINRLFSNIPIEEDRISPKDQAIFELNSILNRLNLDEYSRVPKNIYIIGKTVDFVLKQPDEFIEFYINAFIQDCYNAYQNGQMSCVGGIVERFYMIIGDAAYAMCPDETCDNPTYVELLTLFDKKLDKNELTQEWAETYLESDEIKNMSKSDRKQHYIDFMKSKYKELYMLDETNENLINKEADNLDYVFESLQFGGKKRNKQTRKNRNRTKKRLRKLKVRVRTIKVKKGKRRVSRKRPHSKRRK